MSKKHKNKDNVVPMKPEKTLKDIEAAAIATAQANAKREAAEREAELAQLRAKYPMRSLNGSDLFKVLAIFAKLGIKDDLVQMYKDNVNESIKLQKQRLLQDHKEKAVDTLTKQIRHLENEATVSLRGVDIMANLFEKVTNNIGAIQNDLNEFLASLLGKTAQEVAELPLGDYFFVLRELFNSEDIKTVFKSASSLVG